MRIGITGWKGFIGSHLASVIKEPVLSHGDLRDTNVVMDFVRQCDRIYHVAAMNKGDNLFANNIVTTGKLVLAIKTLRTEPEVIYISSTKAETAPNTDYGISKLLSEDIIKRLDRWCIIRPPNIYGVGGRPFYNSVVATFAYQIANKQRSEIAQASAEFAHIDDLIEIILKPKKNKYLPITGEVLSIPQVYEYMTTKLGEHPRLAECVNYWKEANNEVSKKRK